MNHAMRVLRDVVLVRHKDNRVSLRVQPVHQGHDLVSGLRVQVAGWLIGQNNRWPIHQRSRNRHSLALAAGKLVGLVMHAGFHAHRGQSFSRPLAPLLGRHARVNQRQFDVVQRSRSRQQIEGLKHKSNFSIANARQLIIIQLADQLSVEPVIAFAGRIQAADQVHQG